MYRVIGRFTHALLIDKWIDVHIVEVFGALVGDLKYYPRLRRRFEIRRARQDDVSALQSFFDDIEIVTDRLSRQDVCIILVADGRILAAEWVAVGPNVYREDWAKLRCVFRFPAGACWLYDGLCDKDNAGAWGILIACLKGHLDELEVKEVFFQIDYSNVASINDHKALGCHSMGRLVHVLFLGLSLSCYKTHGGRWSLLPVDAEHLRLCRD